MEKLKVPQYLHRPYQVLFFEVDELAAFILGLLLALFFGGIFWLLVILSVFLLSYTKKKYPRGYLKHFLYVLGLIGFKNTPSFFEKNFRE